MNLISKLPRFLKPFSFHRLNENDKKKHLFYLVVEIKSSRNAENL